VNTLKLITVLLFTLCLSLPAAKRLSPQEWIKNIEKIMPGKTSVKAAKRKVLVFSLATGYKHYVIPYVNEVMKLMATKTGAFDVTFTKDIDFFNADKLKEFDAIVLNNNCSHGKDRNLFRDVLINRVKEKKYKDLTLKEREAKALTLEQNLIDYVKNGKGLMVLHGAINILNRSNEVSDMMGGSFDYHPKFQKINLQLVEPAHPLLKAFDNKGITYEDEPYIFKRAYDKLNFRPLLRMDTSKLVKIKDSVKEKPRYMAWIKKYGQGRVFFSSPGHSHTTYENPKILRFYLDGLQYVLGDLKCPDSAKKE